MNLDEHRVRERAYYIWEDEGREFGHADAHWLRAESELRAGPAVVRASADAVSLAPSPAKSLKTRASRAKTTAEAMTDKAPKPAAKTVAGKPTTAKPSVAKPASKAASPRASRKAPAAGVALH